MYKVIIESQGLFKDRKISGIALTPTFSVNGNSYPPDVIDDAQNIGTPLKVFWEHTAEEVGTVVYTLDPVTHTIYYDAIITDQKRASEIKEGIHKVSIDALGRGTTKTCTPRRCYYTPMGLIMDGISITTIPSVPTATLVIRESQDFPVILNGKCDECSINNSHIQNQETNQVMTDSKTTDKVETKTEEVKITETVVETKPVEKTEIKEEVVTQPKEEPKTWIPNMDEINQKLKEQKIMIDELKERINNPSQLNELNGMITADKLMRSNQIAKLSPQASGKFKQEDLKVLSEAIVPSIRKYGHFSWTIDLSPEMALATNQRIREAISFSTDQAQTLSAMNEVFVLPGGKYIKSIRDLVRFKEIAQGSDMVKFVKGDIPNNGTITEGSSTTASTHTITTINLQADTVTGVFQKIKRADVEDSPFEIMSYLNQTARAESLEAEATLVYTTAAAAVTPNLWVNANSGATITHTDISGMTMEPVSLRVALQDLENSGYDTSFGNAYCILHPKALRELRGSTNLTDYVQRGDATITKTGQLTHLYGIELIPCNAVDTDDNTTNDVYNNVVGIKGHTFALASARELFIEMLSTPVSSSIDWAWSQRKNATTFDAASFIRISSAQ